MTNVTPSLLPGEALMVPVVEALLDDQLTDSAINEKYVKGEIRIVTEQARYPISTIASIVEDPSYRLSPEYQRRHRWSADRQSRLIESLIMNVPLPPIFLYEYDYSKYEVMDGLQRLTAIHNFYRDRFALEGLQEWGELNGKRYTELPSKVREGIDRRYLSSVILLKETARTEEDALRLKQLVFERINSGGVRLSPQESRNAIFDGPLNQKCIELSKSASLCRLWGIPEPQEDELVGGPPSEDRVQNEQFRTMDDVELVLRFFAYRQKAALHKSGVALRRYHDHYLRHGNMLPHQTVSKMAELFSSTIALVESLLGEKAFFLYRKRSRKGHEHWAWLERPTTTVYDPIMFVLSGMLHRQSELLAAREKIVASIEEFYRENYSTFEGRNVNPAALEEREAKYTKFFLRMIS